MEEIVTRYVVESGSTHSFTTFENAKAYYDVLSDRQRKQIKMIHEAVVYRNYAPGD